MASKNIKGNVRGSNLLGFNVSGKSVQYHTSEFTAALQGVYEATGGEITQIAGYTVHTFTSPGVFSVINASGLSTVEFLLVGAGGGGGFDVGGAGGAGGVVYAPAYPVGITTYSIGIGTGGNKSNTPNVDGSNGQPSTFAGIITAYGGGGGGSFSLQGAGQPGGSGGGGGSSAPLSPEGVAGGTGIQPTANPGISGILQYGYPGGNSSPAAYGSGGGGGAGGAGSNGSAGSAVDGGTGYTSSISGISSVYAGGGYGNSDSGAIYPTGTNKDNVFVGYYGFGGNGAGPTGTNGADGIVIIRYPS